MAKNLTTYKEINDATNNRKYKEISRKLPPFAQEYLTDRSFALSTTSILNYAYKMHVFFEYLVNNEEDFMDKETYTLFSSDMESINKSHIQGFFKYLKNGVIDEEFEKTRKNNEKIKYIVQPNNDKSLMNYHSTLNSMFVYCNKNGVFKNNPMSYIELRKPEKKDTVIHLSEEEKEIFMDSVEFGTGLNERQAIFHSKNQYRDSAICKLFLSTGARVSEIVGLNIDDLDLDEHYIKVHRKRNKEQNLFFSDVTETYLRDYLSIRENYHPADNENALFLNRDGKRLGVRSIELLVKKYLTTCLPKRKDEITPHKLRSTYAMNMYSKTKDIELVRSLLGHENLDTVSIYAKATLDDQQESRNILDEP